MLSNPQIGSLSPSEICLSVRLKLSLAYCLTIRVSEIWYPGYPGYLGTFSKSVRLRNILNNLHITLSPIRIRQNIASFYLFDSFPLRFLTCNSSSYFNYPLSNISSIQICTSLTVYLL